VPAIDFGKHLLRQQLARWQELEPALRRGRDPEALHQWRVTSRHLIATLRVLEVAGLTGVVGLRHRVQVLLRHTGPLRDLDVQCAQLMQCNRGLAAGGLGGVLRGLRALRKLRQQALVSRLAQPRTRRLRVALHSLELRPAPGRQTSMALVADQVLRQRYRVVKHRARHALAERTVEQCHQLRLAAKKLRYVAVACAPLYGEVMHSFLRRLERLQSVLGRLNDAQHTIVNLETLLRHNRHLPGRVQRAVQADLAAQRDQLEAAHTDLDAVWHRVHGRPWKHLKRALKASR